MGEPSEKQDLKRYLQEGRDALLWKLDGLAEYDLRRPMTPTGTNLVGVVKHVATMDAMYLGEVFDRPFPEPMPWIREAAAPNDDMWAAADESPKQIVDFYRRVWVHSDQTVDDFPLDHLGRVAWWGERGTQVTLHWVLVHLLAETARHAGQVDLTRELIDGSVGHRQTSDNMAPGDAAWWEAYRERLERLARQAGDASSS